MALAGRAQWKITQSPSLERKRASVEGASYRSMRAVKGNLGPSLSSPQPKSPACGQIFPVERLASCSHCWHIPLPLIVGSHFYSIAAQLHAAPIAGVIFGRIIKI